MNIRFLGTGAADWILAQKGIPEFRFFSSALIDDVLLIDPGPHVFLSAKKFNIDLSNVKYVINTHKHSDHFCEETLDKFLGNGASFIEFSTGDKIKVGEYLISAFTANHPTCENTVHFIIEKYDKRIFYGLDAAWLLFDEVKAIKEKGVNLAVLDATIGNCPGDYRIFEHNNLAMVKEIAASLKEYVEKFIISHMAYTLHENHEVLSKEMQSYGIITALDNLFLEI